MSGLIRITGEINISTKNILRRLGRVQIVGLLLISKETHSLRKNRLCQVTKVYLSKMVLIFILVICHPLNKKVLRKSPRQNQVAN